MIDPELPDSHHHDVSRMTLRQFAALLLVALVGVACWQWLGHGRTTLAANLAAMGVVLGLAGMIKPALIRPLFTVLITLTLPIGWVVSNVLVALIYYIVITPIAIFFKLIGRDALSRRRRSGQETYWQPKPMPADASSYFHQS